MLNEWMILILKVSDRFQFLLIGLSDAILVSPEDMCEK